MRQAEGGSDAGVNQSRSVFMDTPPATVSTETKLCSAFKKDTHPRKLYLAGRECLNEEGQPFVPSLVGKIRQQIGADPTLRLGSSSSLGQTECTRRAIELALGKKAKAIVENRVLAVQTVGCTAAVRLGAELLTHWYNVSAAGCGPVYLSSPCDDSLASILRAAGFQDIRQYHYWDAERRGICLEKMLEDLEKAPEQSIVMLSASAHCPTGAQLSHNDWKLTAQLIMRRRLFPFLLLPEHGLCYGDLERDAWPVQYCASLGIELLCAQSFSHCFGLYDEGVGHLICVLKHNSVLLAVQSQAEQLINELGSQAAAGGARVVATVLSNPAHLIEWQEGLKHMVERCMLIREMLREKLRLLGSPGCWDHLTQQGGLYSCIGLNAQQVDFLSQRRHIYLLPNGCINVSTVDRGSLDYIAESIHQALTSPI